MTAPKKRPPSSVRKQRLKLRLWEEQRGRCFWCKEMMLWNDRPVRYPKRRMVTVDHLDSRLSGRRGAYASVSTLRKVLACWGCNHARGAKEVATLPIEEQHQRSGRFPLPIELDR